MCSPGSAQQPPEENQSGLCGYTITSVTLEAARIHKRVEILTLISTHAEFVQ